MKDEKWYLDLSRINVLILTSLIIMGAGIDLMYMSGNMKQYNYITGVVFTLISVIYMMNQIIKREKKVVNKL